MAPNLPRPLKLGSRGRDVSALQRGLWRAGYRKLVKGDPVETGVFGPYLQQQLKDFQYDHRIPATGRFGQRTFDKLYPHYDARAKALVSLVIKDRSEPVETARTRIVRNAFLGYQKRHLMHYTQEGYRWMGINNRVQPPDVPSWADCSSWTTYLYWLEFGKGPDFINGYHWRAGYTGTQINHGWYVHYSKARPGDMVFYGNSFWSINHVALYVGNGMVIGFGSESGPHYYPIDYRDDRQQIRSYLRD